MCSSALHDVGELRRLALERLSQVVEGRHECVDDGAGGSDVDRAREDVIARLRRVDVVIRVHVTAEPLRRE